MPLQLQCPNPACAKASVAPDGLAGRSVRCKHCGQAFVARPTADGGESDTHPASPPPAAASPAVTLVGRFQVRARLGAGAFGTVYRAHDPQLDREVAVKVPNPGVLADPKRVERFLREARAAAQLRHPHIVPVFDAGKDGDSLYIASAFIHGKPLSETIDETGTDFRRAARVVRELAEALAYAHEQGVVHRDVKPDNILVDAQDRVHLMDFGLASRQEEAGRLTNDGAVMGTPRYMAPEQAAGNSGTAGPAADQYAAGVVLYELLTGKVPFEGPVPIVIHSHIHTPPDPPSKFRPYLSKDLETICLKALAKRPEDRYADCQELADDLRLWLNGEPITARRQTVLEQLTRWAKRNRGAAVWVAALAIALVSGVVVSSVFAVQAGIQALRADREADAARDAQKAAETNAKKEEVERGKAEAALKTADAERQKALTAAGKEQQERQKADNAKLAADAERKKAEEAADEAEKARAKTAQALTELQAAQGRIIASERQARDSAYAANLTLATVQLQSKEARQAVGTLERCPVELRGWEWRLLQQWVQVGRPVSTEVLLPGPVAKAVFTPDRKRVVIGGTDGKLKVADPKSEKKLLWDKQADIKNLYGLAISPDGKTVFSVGKLLKGELPQASFAWLFDAESGKPIRELELPEALVDRDITDLAISPDGTRAALVDLRYGKGVLWNLTTGKSLAEVGPHSTSCAFAPDSQTLAHADNSGVRFCSRDGARVETRIVINKKTYGLTYRADGQVLVFGDADKAVHVWDVKAGKTLHVLTGHSGVPRHFAFLENDTRLLTAGEDGVIKVWDIRNGFELLTIKGPGGAVEGLAVAPDGNGFTAVFTSGKAVSWSSGARQQFVELPPLGRGPIARLAWKPGGGVLAATTDFPDNGLSLIDMPAGRLAQTIPKAGRWLSFSPDGTRVAAETANLSVGVWEANTGKMVHELKGHTIVVYRIYFTTNGTRLITYGGFGGKELEVVIWDANKGDVVKQVIPRARLLTYLPKGNLVVADGVVEKINGVLPIPDGRFTLKLHDATTWKETGATQLTFDPTNTSMFDVIEFSPDGTLLVIPPQPIPNFIDAKGKDYSVLVFDAKSGKRVATLGPQTKPVSAIAFSPDGRWLATGSDDETVKIWDMKGKASATPTSLQGYKAKITALAFSPDGRWLATGDANGKIRAWDLSVVLPPAKKP